MRVPLVRSRPSRPRFASLGAALLADVAHGAAALVLLHPALPLAQDLDPHVAGERVDHAHADAVQAAGDLVAAAAELAAGVQHGVHDLERALARGVLADRDAAAVIDHLDRAVGVDRHVDPGGQVGHRLVDAVVDDLPDELVQAARVGRADVHAGALADGLQAFEHLDIGSGVVRFRPGASRLARGFDGHARSGTSSSLATDAAAPLAPRVMIE